MSMLPKSGHPNITRAEVAAIVAAHAVTDPVAIVGIRGYYKRTMGNPAKNDRGIYDDCIAVITPDRFEAFNANVDPSAFRRGVASLVPGVHPYRKGKHGITREHPYDALRPATKGEALPVARDGIEDPRPGIAINIHRGSRNSTSSEGCQTIHPDQYHTFITMVYSAMDRHAQSIVPYILVEY